MNARLQRIWVLLRLAVALWVGWRFGWAWGVATLGLHAAVLALGFAQLRWVNRPAPGWGQLLRAWAGEVAASELAFSWRQPWREWAEPDHLPAGATQGVLLVHGFSCNRGRWNGWMRRLRAQGVAFVAPTLEPAFGSIDAYADEIEAGVQQLKRLTGRMPLLCAHSMGGLALRAWWRRHGAGHGEAPRVITLGSPHQGTRMAALGLGVNAAQMRQGSAWLAQLPGLPDVDCFWTPCDQIVNPAERAVLPGARAHRLDGVGHMGLVHAPEAWQLVQDALASSFSTPRRI
ncbi:permease [Pelomonas sp. UHG3]|uniref:Permease n=1 Tax=Roseateles hydrophilus TaxID=2975054 RepID=A0ACC6CA18_9BURK|nr:permease [Pelomonas sp. UHG3]MCY4745232.1 permease [Pelomonas sp. UHG3]